jgi:GNAT superfamily N-acetyltransferase
MPAPFYSDLLSANRDRKETEMNHETYPSKRLRHHKPEAGAVLIRPVALEDEEGLRGMLSRLSRESIYLRFHAPYPRAPEWAVVSFADANRPDGESIVAVAHGEIVGHAMYVRQGADEAEFAVVVEDRWQARGAGKALLRALAARARDRGVETFTGAVLGENRRMLGLVRSAFAGVGYAIGDGAYQVKAPLRAPEPAASPEAPDAARPLGLSA